MDGIIVVRKEKDYTSFDVVARLRGILKERKIGHTGTLDPMAEGVLPVCLGAGTKLCDMMTDTGKIYRAVLKLGEAHDTEDVTGTLIHKSEVQVTEEEVRNCIASFTGEYDQIPPMYSAIKIDGKKLYDLAREGKEVTRPPRRIAIHEIRIEQISLPYVTMVVECSKGTYIRSLCRDIGEKLGCFGCMAELTRTYTAGFGIDEAKTIDEIEAYYKSGRTAEILFPVDTFFKDLPEVTVHGENEKYADNGNVLKLKDIPGERVRVYREDRMFYGIYRQDNSGMYKPEKMFFCKGTGA